MCLLYTLVKNHEGSEVLPYLQDHKFTHHSHTCWWKKIRLQDRQIIIYSNSSSQSSSIFAAVSLASSPTRATQIGPGGCPWIALKDGNHNLRKLKSFILESKHACPLFQSMTYIFPSLFTIQTSLER